MGSAGTRDASNAAAELYGPSTTKEKGIDVLLAVDFVMMAMRKEYDVGVLFSADTDLVPALEAVIGLCGPDACEVACWVPSDGSSPRRLRVRGEAIHSHKFTRADYDHVADQTDYTAPRRRR